MDGRETTQRIHNTVDAFIVLHLFGPQVQFS